jgi:hypothetical protein
MASLQAWADPVPVLTLCLITLAMNARYLLHVAAVVQRIRPSAGRRRGWLGQPPVGPSMRVSTGRGRIDEQRSTCI